MGKGKTPSASLVAAALVAALCCGCSIKEDRSLCPCSLVLDFSEVEEALTEQAELFISGADGFLYHDGCVISGIIREEDTGNSIYRVTAPKTRLALSVVSGADAMFSPDSGILIPLGEECPPVYIHYSEADALSEELRQDVSMHKDYCSIGIDMKPYAEPYPYRLCVIGNVNGIRPDRSVISGDFSCSVEPDTDGKGTVRVPRQRDNSLVLQIRDSDMVLREFSLGEYIAETGYDWSEEDLKDVKVEINYANSYISINVSGWSGSYEFDVEI